ncbi:MAG: ABC transporter permease [Gammaproteobacteria bacterium]
MKFFPLVWAGLWRRPVRSILTAICIAIAFVLLGLLQGVNAGFDRAIASSQRDMLITRTRVRGGHNMPISAIERIREIPGVKEVTQRSYFMGRKGDADGLAAIATSPDIFFRMVPALVPSKEGLKAMRSTRNGILLTVPMMDNFGWKVGDTITMSSQTLKTDGSGDWSFKVVGTIGTPQALRPQYFGVINYDYLNEYRVEDRNTAETFYLRIDDGTKAVATSAAVDRIFANSSHETRTQSQQANAASQAKQMGDVKFFTNAIMGAVLFTLAFLTGNTLRQSLQDRSREFAVLKAMGYSGNHVLSLAFAEALLLYLPPALLGLGIARLLVPLWQEEYGSIGSIVVSSAVVVAGLLCAAGLAFIGAALPASSLSRRSVAFALGKR